MGFADDDALTSLLLCLGHQHLDAADVGTGGVYTVDPAALQIVQHTFELSVRADDHRLPCFQVLRGSCLADAPAGQILHHMGVVDEVSQHPAAAGLFRRLLRHLHGALHAIAKAGAFGQDHFRHVWSSLPRS